MAAASDVPSTRRPRWYVPTPAKFLCAMLLMQGVLFLSARYRWFSFNERKGYTVLITVAATGVALLLLVVAVLVSRFFKSKSQFSLATLLLMVPVMGIPCGWLAHEIKLARQQVQILETIRSHKGSATYFESPAQPGSQQFHRSLVETWPLSSLGHDFFYDVRSLAVSVTSNAEIEQMKQLSQLHVLHVGGPEVNDIGTKHLQHFVHLTNLGLHYTHTTDVGLGHLKELRKLKHLTLNQTHVTNKGVQSFSESVPPTCEVTYMGLPPPRDWSR